jgi:hypothetical protein
MNRLPDDVGSEGYVDWALNGSSQIKGEVEAKRVIGDTVACTKAAWSVALA